MSQYLIQDGVNLAELAKKVGTPLTVYRQSLIEDKLSSFIFNLKSEKFRTLVTYAGKAFTCSYMVKLVDKYGCGLDVVSGGELYLAKKSGFDMNRIVFHGNNKTDTEIKLAFEYGIGNICIDNTDEFNKVLNAALEHKKNIKAILRINPHISAHTHKYDVTADKDSKFGISIDDTDTVISMIERLESNPYTEFAGIHAHIGSQIFDKNAFAAEIDKMTDFMATIERRGYKVHTLDLGGGFAARYTDEDSPIPVHDVCKTIIETTENAIQQKKITLDLLMIEPGRSIVGEAGTTLYTVGSSKHTFSKKFVFVDGGMSDNIRPALYGAKYSADIVNRMDSPKNDIVTIAGKCCESGDILIEDYALQKSEIGDILAVYTTGAYGYSMASNYNKIGRPAVVFIKDGKSKLVVRHENYEDMCLLDCEEELLNI